MQVKYSDQWTAEARLVTCFEGEQPETEGLPVDIAQSLQDLVVNNRFKPDFGATLTLLVPKSQAPSFVILMGLGKADDFNAEKVRKLAGKAFKEARKCKAQSLDIGSQPLAGKLSPEELGRALTEGAMLAAYKFDKYRSERKENPVELINIRGDAGLIPGINEGLALAEAVNLARRLTDEPGNVMSPTRLAEEAEATGAKYGFNVQIRDEAGIRALGMEAFLAVAHASDNPPRLIVMRYMGDPDRAEILGLVGKGLTFDSGGLSLKPPQSMNGMNGDMAGAAAVIGAMAAIAGQGLKVNVVGVIAACENMVSGKSYRVNDIVGSMAGKSIEVLNTDAEGRLTLADAVYYTVAEEKATKVLDIATLTGVPLGKVTTAVLSTDGEFFNALAKAAESAGERIWLLPSDDDLKELIKSDLADLRNTSKEGASTITGGLFIGAFAEDKPWLHLDIGSTSWRSSESDYHPKGATGVGVRTMYHLAKAAK